MRSNWSKPTPASCLANTDASPTSTIDRRSGCRYSRATRWMSSDVIALTRSRNVCSSFEIEAVEHRVEHLQRDRARRLDRQREAAGQVRLRVGQLALAARAARCSRQNSSTISRSASPVVSERVSVSATMSPASLSAFDVGRRAVGQPALGAQHVVQPVAAFAAEDLDREVERQVVGVLARHADVADADLGLHRVGLVDDDDAARRRRRLDRLRPRQLGAAPSCRTRARRRRTLPRR